jgi:nucleoid DNA-binding protein
MTKDEFVDEVAAKSGLSRDDAGRAVDAVLESVGEAFRQGDDVQFTGLSLGANVGEREPESSASPPVTADGLRAEAVELKREADRLHERIEADRATLREIAAG